MRMLVLIASVAMAAGCYRQDDVYRPRGDVTMRIVVEGRCSYCKTVDYASMGKVVSQLKVGAVVVRPHEIESITRRYTDPQVIWIAFEPSAHRRVQRVTQDNVGELMAILSGNVVVSVSRIAAPFSSGVQMAGVEAPDADHLVDSIAGRD